MRPVTPNTRTVFTLLQMTAAVACAVVLSWSMPVVAQTASASAQTASASAQTQAAAFEAAFQRLQQAGPGNDSAVDDAVAQFDQLVQREPGDPVLRAYLGAATAMRATTTILPWKKIGHAEDGLAQIDKALALLGAGHDAAGYRHVPAALEVRLVAANTFLRLPAFFNRQERGRKLLAELLASPQLPASPAGFRASVWLRAGELAAQDKQPEQARQWYERAAATDTAYATTARKRLQEL